MASPRQASRTGADPTVRAALAATILGALALLASASHCSEPIGTLAPAPTLQVDPNTAPEPVLANLPTLGPTRVEALIKARAERPFDSAEDLEQRVKGIGPATLQAIRPFLRFD